MLRDEPQQAAQELDRLVDEVFLLVEREIPEIDVATLRDRFHTRRQLFHNYPLRKSNTSKQ